MPENIPSKNLSQDSIDLLRGAPEISYIEPEQIYQAPPLDISVPNTTINQRDRLNDIVDSVDVLLKRISSLKSELDTRCKKFSASASGSKGSPLYQAMFRVFNEKTETVTYDHYKRALDIRKTLAEEDAKELKAK